MAVVIQTTVLTMLNRILPMKVHSRNQVAKKFFLMKLLLRLYVANYKSLKMLFKKA